MRKRAIAWNAFWRWTVAAKGVRHSISVEGRFDYLDARVSEPRGRTALDAIVWLCSFIDVAFGVEKGSLLILASALKEFKLRLAQGAFLTGRSKALRHPAT